MTDTRLSVATNAAAWVLHHGYDDEDDTSADRVMLADDEQIRLAEQIAQRVLRHVDTLAVSGSARGHLLEALAAAEAKARRVQLDGIADTIRRAVQEFPLYHDDCDVPEGHVVVPVAELEALRTVYEAADHADGLPTGYGCNIRGGWGNCAEIETLLEHIPEPPDPAIEIVSNYLANAQGNRSEPKATDIVFYLRQAGLLSEVTP